MPLCKVYLHFFLWKAISLNNEQKSFNNYASNKRHVIIWTNDGLNIGRTHASLGLDELMPFVALFNL